MLKKVITMCLLGLLATSANAECYITSVRDNSVSAAFSKFGGWRFDSFDRVCEKLKRANARIQVIAQSVVLDNRSIGWATLSVVDRDTGIGTSSYATMNTQVNSYASQDKADQVMVDAMNAAAQDWNGLDQALAELEEERRRARGIARRTQ